MSEVLKPQPGNLFPEENFIKDKDISEKTKPGTTQKKKIESKEMLRSFLQDNIPIAYTKASFVSPDYDVAKSGKDMLLNIQDEDVLKTIISNLYVEVDEDALEEALSVNSKDFGRLHLNKEPERTINGKKYFHSAVTFSNDKFEHEVRVVMTNSGMFALKFSQKLIKK